MAFNPNTEQYKNKDGSCEVEACLVCPHHSNIKAISTQGGLCPLHGNWSGFATCPGCLPTPVESVSEEKHPTDACQTHPRSFHGSELPKGVYCNHCEEPVKKLEEQEEGWEEKTIEDVIKEKVNLENYGEWIDKEWSENLQIENGFIESHPMLPFDYFVKLIVAQVISKARKEGEAHKGEAKRIAYMLGVKETEKKILDKFKNIDKERWDDSVHCSCLSHAIWQADKAYKGGKE